MLPFIGFDHLGYHTRDQMGGLGPALSPTTEYCEVPLSRFLVRSPQVADEGASIDGEGNILFGDDQRTRPRTAIAGPGPCVPDPGVRTCTEAERAFAAVPQDGSTTAVVLQLFVEFMLVRGDGELVAADGDFGAEEPSQIKQLHRVETRGSACLRSSACTLYGVSALMRCVYACNSSLDCAYH